LALSEFRGADQNRNELKAKEEPRSPGVQPRSAAIPVGQLPRFQFSDWPGGTPEDNISVVNARLVVDENGHERAAEKQKTCHVQLPHVHGDQLRLGRRRSVGQRADRRRAAGHEREGRK